MPKFKSLGEVPSRLYRAYIHGNWRCEVPTVCTAGWNDLAWINHIGAPELDRVAKAEEKAAEGIGGYRTGGGV